MHLTVGFPERKNEFIEEASSTHTAAEGADLRGVPFVVGRSVSSER
jgi:hypothetical protein